MLTEEAVQGIAEEAMEEITGLVPPSHRHHRLCNLKPYPNSERLLSLEIQASLIAEVRKLGERFDDLHGVVFTGPAGTSKTTFASALLVEWAAHLVLNGYDLRWLYEGMRHNHWIYTVQKLKVPSWIADIQAWDTRDWEDRNTEAPRPTLKDVEQYPPRILVLEEIDKFSPTVTRLDYLFRVVDAVYEAKSTILVTANKTEAELRKALGEPISRRIFGDQEDTAQYVHFDLHAAVSRSSGAKRKSV